MRIYKLTSGFLPPATCFLLRTYNFSFCLWVFAISYLPLYLLFRNSELQKAKSRRPWPACGFLPMFEKKFFMNTAVLSLGTNIGNRLSNLAEALRLLKEIPCSVLKISSVYKTAPWGNTDQPAFYNQVIEIETGTTADELMKNILNIEMRMGRTRNKKWEPRIIDIDILFFNQEIIEGMNLRIPHQHLHERRFILEPLNEILPHLFHPGLKLDVEHLLSQLDDDSVVERLKSVTPQ